MKISVLTPNFSANCFGRAWLLARILQKRFDVEVIGPAFGCGIWGPLKDSCDFETKVVRGFADGKFEVKKMLRMIQGDVIYASKPVMPSFGIGLMKKVRTRKPLVLDIDDYELGFGKKFYDSLGILKKINDFRLTALNLNSYYYTVILDKLVFFANAITVAGKVLHSRYGGTIIYHGRDINAFNPETIDERKYRREYLPDTNENTFIMGFVGTPRPHKGVEDIIYALKLSKNADIVLLIIGSNQGEYCNMLRKMVKELGIAGRVIFFPEQPFDKLPSFLSIIDLVAIPQRKMWGSYGQVPAKIFDAMAMAKPIVSTDTGDIPDIIGGCGWVVESQNPRKLAKAIQHVFDHPEDAKIIGLKAREKLRNRYSWAVIERQLFSVFENLKQIK